MTFSKLTIEEFSARLASGEPSPGGGAAAALMASLGASLVQMVANHTIGRKKYAAVEPRAQEIVSKADELGKQALGLMDADARAFDAVARTLKLDRADPHRAEAISEGCKVATETPLDVISVALALAALAEEIGRIGNQTLKTDARTALFALRAAGHASAVNVLANRPFILDADWSAAAIARAEAGVKELDRLAAEVS